VKPAEHLGTRKGNILKAKLMSLKIIIIIIIIIINKNIRDMYRGINEFTKGYQL
jgi:hypothetical protein